MVHSTHPLNNPSNVPLTHLLFCRRQAWEDTSSDAPSNRSDAPSAFDPTDPAALQSRCKSYLESLRLALSKKALRMRQDGSLPHSETITMQTTDLIHNVSRSLLSKAFQPYTGVDSGRARQGATSLARVELGDFVKVTPLVSTQTYIARRLPFPSLR